MTCEKCGNIGHSGKSCPFTLEDENSIGNNSPNNSDCRPQQGSNSLSPTSPSANSKVTILISFQPSLKNFMYGQKQMNDNISEKFLANDKIIESLAMQLDAFNSIIKHQLNRN